MGVATVVFWFGRNRYARVSPVSWVKYKEAFHGRENITRWHGLCLLYLLLSTFWALFDQMGSSWVLQAERMERTISVPFFGTVELLAAQLQAINPLLILIFTPLFAIKVYPWCEQRSRFGTRERLWLGMVLAGVSFLGSSATYEWSKCLGDVASICVSDSYYR